MVDFIALFAPHLTPQLTRRTAQLTTQAEVDGLVSHNVTNEQFRTQYAGVFDGSAELACAPAYEAATFVDEVLRKRFALAELLVGHDHGFGRGR